MELFKGDFCEPSSDSPLLLAELTPGRARQFDWKSSCETWSVGFSPDGAWFAWSRGHCIVKLIPWPPPEANLRMHTFEQKKRCTKATDVQVQGTDSKEKTLDCGQIVWGLAFSAHSSNIEQSSGLPDLILATGLNDGHIKIWEVLTGRLLFNLSGHTDVVRDLSFTPNRSRILVSASRDKTIRIWDLKKNGKQIHVLSGHLQWVYCCSISPDCSMMCSAAGEPSVLLWSLRSYTLIRKLEGHQGSVVSCDFSPDAAVLVTASYDLCVIMWDPYTGEKLREFRHDCLQTDLDYRSSNSQLSAFSLRSVRFSPEGLYLATVADDGFLRIWPLNMKKPIVFAHVNNGLCCTFYPQGGIIATGRRFPAIHIIRTPPGVLPHGVVSDIPVPPTFFKYF